MRKTINLPCPGSASNFVVIVATAWQSKYGLGNPKNIGNCELFISPLDENGEPIERGFEMFNFVPGNQWLGIICLKVQPKLSLFAARFVMEAPF